MAVDNIEISNFKEAVKHLRVTGKIRYDSDIAKALGVSKSNLSSYLNGNLEPSKKFLNKFYSHYKIEPISGMVNEAQEEYRTKPALKSVSSDQANAVLMNINSYSFVSVERLCELLAKVSGRPLDEIRKRAQQLISDRRQRVEEVLRLLEDFS